MLRGERFSRNWMEYKNGFGGNSFYVGNELVHKLTTRYACELYAHMSGPGEYFQVSYAQFSLGNETDLYRLTVSGFRPYLGGINSCNTKYIYTIGYVCIQGRGYRDWGRKGQGRGNGCLHFMHAFPPSFSVSWQLKHPRAFCIFYIRENGEKTLGARVAAWIYNHLCIQ